MKICQFCNLDSTMFHFLLPLMRGMKAAGHEVVGVCPPGTFVEKIEAGGFRVETVPIKRSFNLAKHLQSASELQTLFKRERFDIVHVHNPVAALVGRYAAWRTRVPCIAYTAQRKARGCVERERFAKHFDIRKVRKLYQDVWQSI